MRKIFVWAGIVMVLGGTAGAAILSMPWFSLSIVMSASVACGAIAIIFGAGFLKVGS